MTGDDQDVMILDLGFDSGRRVTKDATLLAVLKSLPNQLFPAAVD